MTLQLMAQLGRVWKKQKFYSSSLENAHQCIPQSLQLQRSSHFKCKLSYPTFGSHISIYAWYPPINWSNENFFSFWITKEIFTTFFDNSSEIWMIDISVMCDYCMQRFYFLNFKRHEVLSSMISNVQSWKNTAFEKECSNMKLANMALSK